MKIVSRRISAHNFRVQGKKGKEATMADSAAPTAATGALLTDRTHAVLKLQLGDNGGIRRINFSRLWSPATQTVSYSKLVGLAREYSASSSATTKADDDADVTITYLDEDGDTITISTDEELGEAFLQFVDKVPPVLRASATVNAKHETMVEQPREENQQKTEEDDQPEESEDSQPPPATPFVAPGDEHTGPTLRQPGSTGGNIGNANGSPPEPIVEVLKGVASLLGSVVSSFNQQANANANNSNTPNRSTPSIDPGTEEAERFVREVINNIQMAGPTSTANTSSGATATTASTDDIGLTGFDSTFIHGFHTCDACKKKPIVGYWFHATNRPDYDLCMNCHADEAKCRDAEGVISFEPSELDRDRPNQLRWKSLHESTRSAENKPSPTEADDPCTHFIHGRHTCDGCLTTPIIGLRWHSSNLPDYDLCDRCKGNYKGEDIKFEAVELDRDRAFQTRWQRRQVRRARQARFAHARYAERSRCGKSMSSAQAAAAAASGTTASASSNTATTEAKKGTEVMDVALKEAIRRSLADTKLADAPMKDVDGGDEEKPAPKTEAVDTKPPEKVTVDPKVSQEPSGDLLALKPDLWKCTTCTILNDASDENCCACDEPKVAPSPMPEYVSEAPSTPTEKKDAGEDMVETPASAKTNFSEEAEGIGDVAEHLGATLDACAGAIDAIVTELEFNPKAAEKCPPENPSAPPIEEMDVPDSVSAMTSSILSEEPKEKNDETSNNKNDKVSNDINNGEEDQNEDDEWSMISEQSDALAKATEAIGSALFDFDKKSSTDLAESDINSIPSSVPTVSSSDAAPWADELKKLQELGFTDDMASIGALNLLNKGAEAPVPIENIVEYLCATAETDDEAEH